MQTLIQSQSPVYRILLVADGEPLHGGLEPLSYGHEKRALLDGFYARQRERIVAEAVKEGATCAPTLHACVMTTGFGAVAAGETLSLYNVPGELAIQQPAYLQRYKTSLVSLLPSQATSLEQVTLIYYAALSKRVFRESVFALLREISNDSERTGRLQIRACMYGDRFHRSNRWRDLCHLFDLLESRDEMGLQQQARVWKERAGAIAPFFEWF